MTHLQEERGGRPAEAGAFCATREGARRSVDNFAGSPGRFGLLDHRPEADPGAGLRIGVSGNDHFGRDFLRLRTVFSEQPAASAISATVCSPPSIDSIVSKASFGRLE